MADHDPDRPEGEQIRPGPLIGGILLGFVLTWVVFTVVLFSLYATYGDSSSTTQNVIAAIGFLGLPVLLGLLLIPRRTRHWGAGMLLGIALGSISAAGVCGSFVGLNAV